MKIKEVMLFAYDFPHKKTQDFIFNLLISNYKINYVIAAPKIKLNIPVSKIRINPIFEGVSHPEKICKHFDIPYFRISHNSPELLTILKSNPVDLYIISGARILNKNVIKAAQYKILNIHPGILPEIRGLDTLQWSIYYDKPIGISAHFISEKIDLGNLIYKDELNLFQDDLVRDISLRLIDKQPEVLLKSLDILKSKKLDQLENINLSNFKYNPKMSEEQEAIVFSRYKKWLYKYASK